MSHRHKHLCPTDINIDVSQRQTPMSHRHKHLCPTDTNTCVSQTQTSMSHRHKHQRLSHTQKPMSHRTNGTTSALQTACKQLGCVATLVLKRLPANAVVIAAVITIKAQAKGWLYKAHVNSSFRKHVERRLSCPMPVWLE